jgi:hypothetical protein
MASLAERLDVHRSELTAGVKFATKYTTEEQLTNAISQFGSWFALKQHGLTDTPRVQTKAASDDTTSADVSDGLRTLRRVLKLLDNVDPATFDEDDDAEEVLARIADDIARLRVAIPTLGPRSRLHGRGSICPSDLSLEWRVVWCSIREGPYKQKGPVRALRLALR